MANAMRIGICSSISFETRGIDRFMIHTGFSFPDGDELHIILKRRGGGWILTDEGHTSMWVSYSVNLSENRRRLLEKVAGSNGIGFEDGVMSVDASVENAAGCLMSMIQAILQASELSYLTRSTVHNTFVEDTKQTLREKLGSRCEFDKHLGDKEDIVADAYIDDDEPTIIFIVSNKERCLTALYGMVVLSSEIGMRFRSLTIVDESNDIPESARNKLINRSDKLFIGHIGMNEDFDRYLEKRTRMKGREHTSPHMMMNGGTGCL